MPEEERTFVYRIDADNRIASVNNNWVAFAQENEAPHLTHRHVNGKPLRQFIFGLETWKVYQLIFEKVRNTGSRTTIPFRCDSPDQRRFMEMTILPLAGRHIEMHNHVVRVEYTDYNPLWDELESRSDEFLTVCSWCKQVQSSLNQWVDADEVVREMNLFASPHLPKLKHAICPTCLDVMTKDMADEEN